MHADTPPVDNKRPSLPRDAASGSKMGTEHHAGRECSVGHRVARSFRIRPAPLEKAPSRTSDAPRQPGHEDAVTRTALRCESRTVVRRQRMADHGRSPESSTLDSERDYRPPAPPHSLRRVPPGKPSTIAHTALPGSLSAPICAGRAEAEDSSPPIAARVTRGGRESLPSRRSEPDSS